MANFITRTHLNRYRQIAEVLLHHGLGYLVSTLGLERFVPFFTHNRSSFVMVLGERDYRL